MAQSPLHQDKIVQGIRDMETEALIALMQRNLKHVMDGCRTEVYAGESWFISVMMAETVRLATEDEDMIQELVIPLIRETRQVEVSPDTAKSFMYTASEKTLVLSAHVAFDTVKSALVVGMEVGDSMPQSLPPSIQKCLLTHRPIMAVDLYMPLVIGGLAASVNLVNKKQLSSSTFKKNIQLLTLDSERRKRRTSAQGEEDELFDMLIPGVDIMIETVSQMIEKP